MSQVTGELEQAQKEVESKVQEVVDIFNNLQELETQLTDIQTNTVNNEVDVMLNTATQAVDAIRSTVESAIEQVVKTIQDASNELGDVEGNISSERGELEPLIEELRELLAPLQTGIASAQELADKFAIPWA